MAEYNVTISSMNSDRFATTLISDRFSITIPLLISNRWLVTKISLQFCRVAIFVFN